ncbi:hypothetical protein HYS97_00525 [Candidatus Daviesbacteria bacterium]|nr:hypothetical protein [Candidatus Daviesbacteria bacterium]
MQNFYTVVIFVPLTHADILRKVIGDAGAGSVGRYSHCSFSSKGIGRYLPLKGAKPYQGEVGKLESIEEERIEVICQEDQITKVIKAMKEVHPYEEPAFYVYSLLNEDF